MALSLNRAAKEGKVAKTTLQRALENGEISSTKNAKGHWQIDESEFGRWLSSRSAERFDPDLENRTGTQEETTENNALEREVKLLREMLDETRADRDSWKEHAQKITALIEDQTPRQSLWRRIFG